jgi:hypothetical protein
MVCVLHNLQVLLNNSLALYGFKLHTSRKVRPITIWTCFRHKFLIACQIELVAALSMTMKECVGIEKYVLERTAGYGSIMILVLMRKLGKEEFGTVAMNVWYSCAWCLCV